VLIWDFLQILKASILLHTSLTRRTSRIKSIF
jgi:hypothetical protein